MTTAGMLYALSAAVLWGVVYVISEKILQTTTPFIYLLAGYGIAAVVTLPFIVARWGWLKGAMLEARPLWGWIVVVELLVFVANFFILASINELGSPLASALEISYPFFVALFAFLALGSTMNVYFWVGAGLIFAGAAIITLFA